MEIKYKYLLIISIILSIIFSIVSSNKKHILKDTFFIANTEYIENTDYFKQRLIIYKFLKTIITIFYIISLICIFLLIGRLSIKDTNNYPNDILLCLDVSANIDKSNLDLVNNLLNTKNIYKNTNYGISIFNTSSAIISPLTHDYNYIKNELKTIKKSIQVNNPDKYGKYNKNDYLLLKNYIVSGTTYNYQEKGTSLIGDGLNTCINNINKSVNKNKIIILSTDNSSAGKETISIKEAHKKAKENNIKIISIIPENINEINKKELRDISNKIFYSNQNRRLNNYLIDNINNNNSKDIPTIPIVILTISISITILLKKVII